MANQTQTISVTCPCGESFDREVKRGRPAQWCPACREIPMAKRSHNVDPSEETPSTTPRRLHDPLPGTTRELIEANVAAVDVEYKTVMIPNKAKLFAKDERGVDRALSDWYFNALQEAYKSVTPNWWTRSGEAAV